MKTNLVLFIIALLLALVIYFEPGLNKSATDYLTHLKSDQIDKITIERSGLETILLEKNSSTWRLTEPLQIQANRLRVDTITALAEKQSYSRFSAIGKNLSTYQLDNPPITVWLNDTKLLIGAEEPVNKRRYAMTDNIIQLINGTVYYQLRAQLNNFISLSLLPDDAMISSIQLPQYLLKVSEGRWHLNPDDPTIAADDISQLLSYWKTVQATGIKTDVPKAQGEQVIINMKNHLPIIFTIVAQQQQVSLVRNDLHIAYQLSADLVVLLTRFAPFKPDLKPGSTN